MEDLDIEKLKADLEAAKAEADAERKQRAAAEAALAKAEGAAKPSKIAGKYKGFSFADNHRNVRNRSGELCDTTKLMGAAGNKNHPDNAAATATLDWLLEIKYAYLTK